MRLTTIIILLALVCACQSAPHDSRRPWAGDAALESVTIEGKTLRARRLPGEPRVQTLPLGPVAAGEVWLSAAFEDPSAGSLQIRLMQPARIWSWISSSPPEGCTIDATTWQSCRLPIPHSSSEAALEVRFEGPPDARVVISSPALHAKQVPAHPPVFIILMDTVRFDRLVTYRPDFPLGTRLDELARDGVVFERAYSSSSWTRTAVATLLTGLDARTHRVLGRTDVLRADLEGLPQVLQRAGWYTMAWSTNANILPLWGFDAGFDVFVDLGALEWAKNKTDAATVFTAVRDALAKERAIPTLHYVHLMDAHVPFQPPPDELKAIETDPRLAESFPGQRVELTAVSEYRKYLAEIRDLDGKLGRFLDDLRERGLYRPALILVASDHGEEFLDHGRMYHGQTLYEEVLRVPVILKLPENELAGTRIQQDVGLADIAPTIAGILGAGGFAAADGRDLWDAARRRLRDEGAPQNALLELDTYQLGAWVQDWRKLIVDYQNRQEQLFDLRADPREERDLLPAATAEASRLRAALDGQVARRLAGWHVRACGGLTAERLPLVLEANGEVVGVDLEPADALQPADEQNVAGIWNIHLELTPGTARREVFGKLVEEDTTDEDEIVHVPAGAGTITLRNLGRRPLRYSLGTEETRRTTEHVELGPADTAVVVAPSVPVHCWNPSDGYAGVRKEAVAAREPYVRIWYVPPPQRKAGEVDAAVKERLRALGYAW